jgi:hypothetical protein
MSEAAPEIIGGVVDIIAGEGAAEEAGLTEEDPAEKMQKEGKFSEKDQELKDKADRQNKRFKQRGENLLNRITKGRYGRAVKTVETVAETARGAAQTVAGVYKALPTVAQTGIGVLVGGTVAGIIAGGITSAEHSKNKTVREVARDADKGIHDVDPLLPKNDDVKKQPETPTPDPAKNAPTPDPAKNTPTPISNVVPGMWSAPNSWSHLRLPTDISKPRHHIRGGGVHHGPDAPIHPKKRRAHHKHPTDRKKK